MNLTALLTLSAALVVSPALAEIHLLTIGGGHSPSANQVSLEKNVLFFEKLIAEKLPNARHDLFFADGTCPHPDVQFLPANDDTPEANVFMAALFGSKRHLRFKYRDNQLENTRDVSSPEAVDAWFQETGPTLQSGDRLVLYITAHGGKSSHKDDRHNTKIYMWNGKTLEASHLAALIAGLPEGVSVITVMVQCFSGGFSHLIFEGNQAEKGPVKRDICGFFATVFDREAAGCTADINEEDYDEYSSHFWAALRGETRMGAKVTDSDYNGDGRVSFEEAHAYTMITSKNIDVPIKTTDAFLRRHRTPGNQDTNALLSTDTPYFQILTHARAADLAVLDNLSSQLGLTGARRAALARERCEELENKRQELAGEDKEKKKQLGSLRRAIATDIKNRWPQLTNTLSPAAQALLVHHGEAFVKAVTAHPKYPEWIATSARRDEIEKERFEHDKTWARHQRFLRTIENVVLAANLKCSASPEIQSRFEALRQAEASGL